MLRKIIKILKKEIKNVVSNPKEIIKFFIPLIIAIILLLPVPYYITIGGGTISIDKKITIINEQNKTGSLSSAYVKEVKGSVITYLLSKVISSYEVTKIEEVTLGNKEEDYQFRERNYFYNSLDNAVKIAYEKAGEKIAVTNNKVLILYIEEEAITNLKVQDKILEVNDKKVKEVKDFTSEIIKYEYGDIIKIKVLRNKKQINCIAKIININNEKKTGIYINNDYEYETNPNIKFNFSTKESGPSGGLMITLSIYNKLIKDDITKGYNIVGTGTIDEEGNVGEIGGINYKLSGAVKAKADIFIVPKDNYEEALKIKKQKKYKIKIISVSTFEEALLKLKNIK